MNKSLHKYLLALVAVLGTATRVGYAQDAAVPPISKSALLWTLIIAMIVLAAVALVLTTTILILVRSKAEEKAVAAGMSPAEAKAQSQAQSPWLKWSWWNERLTDAVPITREADIDLGHDYDGIRELDNNLPPWWKYGFYFTIGFAAIYLVHFHIVELSFLNPFMGPGISSEAQYVAEIEEAEIAKQAYLAQAAEQVDETNAILLTTAGDLSKGKSIFDSKCVACHAADGGGTIGPNLTDAYWLHGGDIKDVFATIKHGIPSKGMIAWKDQLKPRQIQEVASYILHDLQGTVPAVAKDPEGTLYTPADSSSVEVDSTVIAMTR